MKLLPLFLAFTCSPLLAAPLTVFENGKIVTVDAAFTITDAMAVEGAHIVAFGEAAKMIAADHPEAKRVDLAGRMMLPEQ